MDKQLDLRAKTEERKFLKNALEERADNVLAPRRAYILVNVRKNENDDEICEDIAIDGACMRTPDEDIIWEQTKKEVVDTNIKGKKPPVGKKK